MQYVYETVKATQRELAKRWDEVEQNQGPLRSEQSWSTSPLSFDVDTQLSLLNLQPYLDGILNRLAVSSRTTQYEPNCAPRIDLHYSKFPQGNFRTLKSGYSTCL